VNIDFGLCYQSTAPGSPINNFVGGAYMTAQLSDIATSPWTATASVGGLNGTFLTGLCARNTSGVDIDILTDWANGWLQVIPN
jgi:hypothetical protein